MSQIFHHSLFNFPNGYEGSVATKHIPIQEEVLSSDHDHETAGMLSEMFGSTRVLDSQIPTNYPWMQKVQPVPNKPLEVLLGHENQFLGTNNGGSLNPSSSSSPSSTMLLSNSLNPNHHHHHHNLQGFYSLGSSNEARDMNPPIEFTWVPRSGSGRDHSGRVLESTTPQSLSLSLSSSLQQHYLEGSKIDKLRVGEGFFYDLHHQPNYSISGFDGLRGLGGANQQPPRQQGMVGDQGMHIGYGTCLGASNIGMRGSRYLKAAQQLLEEFCCVGRGHQCLIKNSDSTGEGKRQNMNPNCGDGDHHQLDGGGDHGESNSSSVATTTTSKEQPPLTAAERTEYLRRKVKLLTMIEEVDGRYRRYCEQMAVMANSFDSVVGFGSAAPYTGLAQRAMSRHFRCIKDAIAKQLKETGERLGEKDAGSGGGLTRGETPRLRVLEQRFRQQRASHHQMGMMMMVDPEAWRPQRGLPERSVNALRAWLFEHFLHPYPSEADKHLLSRQTGLSKNQVSNWFINARVRLWKPMVEEMYQQEAKDHHHQPQVTDQSSEPETDHHPPNISAQNPMLPNTTTTTKLQAAQGKRSEFNAVENDPSSRPVNCGQQYYPSSGNQMGLQGTAAVDYQCLPATREGGWDATGRVERVVDYGSVTSAGAHTAAAHVRLGTSAGDVSLTLGLRQTDNREFGAF